MGIARAPRGRKEPLSRGTTASSKHIASALEAEREAAHYLDLASKKLEEAVKARAEADERSEPAVEVTSSPTDLHQ